ncbi:uncharacterized protein LOC119312621 [Triticum dicoccoides]|uniref:uncharacterized protein LOC119312621 n=1 Tax=Triticum dicoccoides TaxID=85692 RepID=UPI0018911587|nr:uncharacterized protein LOC119312621 [Triticum dicoccoides]
MAAPPPAIPDDLVEEILLRLPPDHPAFLLRASIVCKDWAGIVSRPPFRRRLHELHPTPPLLGFLRRLHELHRTPPVPGFLRCLVRGLVPHFIPTTASSFSPAAPDWHSWRAQDCRHGRALFISTGEGTPELLVWEPTTGAQQHVPMPAAFGRRNYFPMATVLCTADGCDHRDCLGGPFHVVFSFSDGPDQEDFDPEEEEEEEEEWVRSLTVYSSETGTWGELTSVHIKFQINYQQYSSLLVGSSLLYFTGMPEYTSITEYDMARHTLTVFEPPGDCSEVGCNLMPTEDGGLGVIEGLFDQHVKLWTREAGDG